MLSDLIRPRQHVRFYTQDGARAKLVKAVRENEAVMDYEVVGRSEAGAVIDGFRIGRGKTKILLAAGAHADEPVGSATLRQLVVSLPAKPQAAEVFELYTFHVIPNVNPDGEAMNWAWMQRWPDAEAYFRDVAREFPGRDVEFGYPEMRVENRCVAEYMKRHGPFDLYVNLHGMSIAEGAMLLIEKHWVERSAGIQAGFAAALAEAGLGLHDHDRHGDKGFQYIGPGFTTTPEGAAMRAYFEAAGDMDMAKLFHMSSMEYVRSLGGDPLCLVTELPLFPIDPLTNCKPGAAENYMRFRAAIPALRQKLLRGETVAAEFAEYGLRPLDLATAIKLQLRVIDLGIEAVENRTS